MEGAVTRVIASVPVSEFRNFTSKTSFSGWFSVVIAILSPAAVPDTAGHGCLKPVKSDKRGHILPGVGLSPPIHPPPRR
jgi:hypothetical protein